jgi:hypothetical protein
VESCITEQMDSGVWMNEQTDECVDELMNGGGTAES